MNLQDRNSHGSDYLYVVLPAPSESGTEFTLHFHYRGNVIENAGNGVLFVDARESWYPALRGPRGLCQLRSHHALAAQIAAGRHGNQARRTRRRGIPRRPLADRKARLGGGLQSRRLCFHFARFRNALGRRLCQSPARAAPSTVVWKPLNSMLRGHRHRWAPRGARAST